MRRARHRVAWGALAMAAGMLIAGCGRSAPAPTTQAAARPARSCPKTVRLASQQTVHVGTGVGALAVQGTTVWVARAAAGTVTRITGAATATVRLGGGPVSLAAGYGRIWVALRDAGQVVAVDPESDHPVSRAVISVPVAVTAGAGGVWALSLDEEAVWQLTPSTGAVANEVDSPVGSPAAMVQSGADLWVLGAAAGGLTPIDAQLARVVRYGFGLPGRSLSGLSAGRSTVWVGEPGRHDLVRVDAANLAVRELPAPGDMAPTVTAVGACGVWVGSRDGTLALINPSTGARLAPAVRVGRSLAALAVSGAGVWATDPVDGTVVHISASGA